MSFRVDAPPTASLVSKLVPLVLASLALVSSAQAEATYVTRGLFCNTEAQLDKVLAHLRAGVSPVLAVELGNERSVECVFADLVRYVVTRPVIIGEVFLQRPLLKYKATLVGVVVGGNLRPVEPPVQMFFVLREQLAEARAHT